MLRDFAREIENSMSAKILVVDDNSVVRDLVSRMLCPLGNEVPQPIAAKTG
jgi:CheY-like chemotaxis protein